MIDRTATRIVRVGQPRDYRGSYVFFELKEALEPGESAEAYALSWTGSTYEIEEEEEEDIIEVHDFLAIRRGRAKDEFGTPHNQGSRGLAWLFPDSKRYEIIEMQPPAQMIQGRATSDWTQGIINIDSIIVMSPVGGLITHQDPGGEISVNDVHEWRGSEDDLVEAAWNEGHIRLDAIQIDCP